MDGLDVNGVRGFRIGHDGRRIGVNQNDPVALLFQRFACLRAGVIEFTGLPDHDWTGADDQDAFDVGALRHFYNKLLELNPIFVCFYYFLACQNRP